MQDHGQRLKERKEQGGTSASFLRDLRPPSADERERERKLRTVTKDDLDLTTLEATNDTNRA